MNAKILFFVIFGFLSCGKQYVKIEKKDIFFDDPSFSEENLINEMEHEYSQEQYHYILKNIKYDFSWDYLWGKLSEKKSFDHLSSDWIFQILKFRPRCFQLSKLEKESVYQFIDFGLKYLIFLRKNSLENKEIIKVLDNHIIEDLNNCFLDEEEVSFVKDKKDDDALLVYLKNLFDQKHIDFTLLNYLKIKPNLSLKIQENSLLSFIKNNKVEDKEYLIDVLYILNFTRNKDKFSIKEINEIEKFVYIKFFNLTFVNQEDELNFSLNYFLRNKNLYKFLKIINEEIKMQEKTIESLSHDNPCISDSEKECHEFIKDKYIWPLDEE